MCDPNFSLMVEGIIYLCLAIIYQRCSRYCTLHVRVQELVGGGVRGIPLAPLDAPALYNVPFTQTVYYCLLHCSYFAG